MWTKIEKPYRRISNIIFFRIYRWFFELDLKIKPPKKNPRKIFLFKRADVDRLRDNISSNLEVLRHIECESASELDDLWIKFKSIILDAVEQNVPSKNISGAGMSHGLHLPWRELSAKSNAFYIAKRSNFRPTKVGRSLRISEKQRRASYQRLITITCRIY